MLAETICSAVSAAGLGIAAITAWRRRALAAVKIAAWSLVPVALVLTGAVQWLSGLAFKPAVWVGVGLLGLSWLLLTVTRAVERRRAGKEPAEAVEGGPARAPRGRAPRAATAPDASAPALGGTAPGHAAPPAAPAGRGAAAEDDFSDIEAILRKHGI
ncbi:hypothetical protein ACN20G_22825 [Streptomyces sp. BI20]|uniref:hypothetical protein n=1 Tax=Streptomyces sp. BI20 TaxID=3403460 RepID=UPI003C72B81F